MFTVDFIILGAAKCGTTSLSNILASHPDVCFCKNKEPHFFSKNLNWKSNLDQYSLLFKPEKNQICGEASTSYTMYPEFNLDTCRDLYEYNPNLKLIYIIRDPCERIISQYMHCYLRGLTFETIGQAIVSDPIYINRTRYFTQINPYINLFGLTNILLLTFEEFVSDTELALGKVSGFLGLDANKYVFKNIHSNKSVDEQKNDARLDDFIKKYMYPELLKEIIPEEIKRNFYRGLQNKFARKIKEKPCLDQGLREVIANMLILDVRKIEELMGRELIEWKDFFDIKIH